MQQKTEYPVRRSADQNRESTHHRVVIIGAGPVGLTLALDLAQQGLDPVLLAANTSPCDGSRAICFAQRTLDIWHRLGVGERMVERGVTWKTGRVYCGEEPVYSFDLQPDENQRMPAFINLQQYAVEEILVDELLHETDADLRFGHRVTRVEEDPRAVTLTVETSDGTYGVTCDYLLAADGARSTVRSELGLDFVGETFDDKFLIADITMDVDLPPERRFWFDPPFNPGSSALLHMQPDGVWRVDLQLGPEADAEQERDESRVRQRIEAMLPGVPFELEWVSVYTFQCRRLERFRHGRILFAGDAAHQVSPFGARGANSGIQDVDNLAWKLAHVVLQGADDTLLDSYDEERLPAADENIRHSTRSTEFITPKSDSSTALRDAVLRLAPKAPFAQKMINSGRLSTPHIADGSFLSSEDAVGLPPATRPGAACPDAPVSQRGNGSFLLDHLGGKFTCLWIGALGDEERDALDVVLQMEPDTSIAIVEPAMPGEEPSGALLDQEDVLRLVDGFGTVAEAYAGGGSACYLIRPDQHVAGRWRRLDPSQVVSAILRCRASFAAN
ncbi:MAG: FAD-dependent oxidoreductase [Acidobacteriota bacterium]